MNRRFENELSPSLKSSLRSLETAADGDVVEAAAEAAQARLSARLQRAQGATRTRAASRSGWAVAVGATIALAVGLVVPMLSSDSDAFAAAQARFRDFDTLWMTVAQRFRDGATTTSRTVVDARGVVRTDVGTQLSVIVDAPRGRILTLQHEPRQAMIAPLPKTAAAQDGALPWLEELRAFKGHAIALKETRIIDGRTAHGWRLRLPGGAMTLWADENELPLAMRQEGGGGLEIDYRFEFDRPIPPELLSSDPPAGYTPVAPDDE